VKHNETLEFLGDRALGLYIANKMFALHKDAKEGELHDKLKEKTNGSYLKILGEATDLKSYVFARNSTTCKISLYFYVITIARYFLIILIL